MLALSVFAVIDAVPVRAQTSVTMVSNIDQAGHTSVTNVNFHHAQGFMTGTNSANYTLKSVEINFSSLVVPSGITVKITTGLSSTSAGTDVATLTSPSFAAGGINTFTAPANTTLSAGTEHFVVISSGSAGATASTLSTSEDPGGLSGWSISNNRHFSSDGNSWTAATSAIFQIRVNGCANPCPSPPPPPPPPVIESPKGVLVGNADQSLPITLKEGDSVPLTPLEEEGSFVYKKRTIDIPVTRDECTSPGNPAVILSKDIIDRIHRRSREIAFELSDISPQDPPPGFRVGGCAVDIDPGVMIGQGKTETVCLPPAEIEGKSYIHHYNDESGEWEPLPSRLETVNGEELLCVDTDSFSQFRVFVPVIESEEVTHREDPKDVFPLTPIGEGGSIVYGPGTIDLSVTGDTDPSYANPAVIVSRSILDRVDEITFELSEVSEYPPPGYRLSGFEAEVNLGIPLRQRETVSVCLPSSGGEEDIYYRYNDESEEWEELLESWPDTVNGEDVLCGDAGAVSLSGVFVEETGGCGIAAAGGEGVPWRGAVFNFLLIISMLLLIPRKRRLGV